MSKIYITSEDSAFFKNDIPFDEEIIYATYALVADRFRGIYRRWNSPIIITNKHIIFIQYAHLKFEEGIKKFPLYKTHVFNNYKHIYISYLDFRPKYSTKLNESKASFKLRWREFQKIILPHVINSQKEHLKFIEANKNNPDFYNKKDLKEMRWFGTEKVLESHIRKIIPKLEAKLKKIESVQR